MRNIYQIEEEIENKRNELRSLQERESYLKIQLAGIPEMNENRLEELNIQLATLRARVSDNHPDVIKTKIEIEEIKRLRGTSNEFASRKNTLNELKQKLAYYQSIYSDKHPDIIKTKREIERLEQAESVKPNNVGYVRSPDNPAYIAISSELAKTRTGIRSVKARLANLSRKKAHYHQRIESAPRIEDELNDLLTERNRKQTKYDDLMTKFLEAKVSHGLVADRKGERFDLGQEPNLPIEPYKPNRLAMLILGTLFSVFIGFAFGFVNEKRDKSIHTIEHFEQLTDLPVLCSIPEYTDERDIIKKRLTAVAITIGFLLFLAGVIAIIHFYIYELDVLWENIQKKIIIIFN